MEFTNPTTQSEMYSALKEIFYYYRIRRQSFEEVTLLPLELERLNFTTLTDAELLEKAQTLNSAEQYAHDVKYREDINKELAVVTAKLESLPQAQTARIEKINADFDQSVSKLNVSLSKNGLSGSSIAVDKLAQLEVEKNRLLDQAAADYQAQIAALTAEQQTLIAKLENAAEYCAEKAERENLAKRKELIDEQNKIIREVFKYNNGLDEKEQRNANANIESNASLELKFLEIQTGEFTKDQLVEMGYYEDVINCVCAYYDTLPVLTAAQQILRDRRIVEYLDDYYESVIYMYQQRALE